MVRITVNGTEHEVDADPDMPLLWALRDVMGLKGTKFGCGRAECGACTVHMDGEAIRSCIINLGDVEDSKITTIEGLSENGDHPLQLAWTENNVPQCGYCQTGQIMNAASLLAENPNPSDEEIDSAMSGNICRCGTYMRIRAAIRQASGRGTTE